MKRIGIACCIILLLASFMAPFAFADEGLVLEESTPKDGGKDAAIENLGIKLIFNEPVGDAANQADNNKCFKLTGPDGELPIKVYYNPKKDNQVLVVYDTEEGTNLATANASKMTLKLEIDGAFKADSGNTLGSPEIVEFTTVDQALNNKIYMGIMMVMVVAMVLMSQKRKKAAEESADESGTYKEEPFNPYKEAKRTGKSVEEVTRQHNKEVARREARAARKAAASSDDNRKEYEIEEDSGNYKVKAPRPISVAGGKYITGRKAAAEAAKAEEERLAKRRAARKKK